MSADRPKFTVDQLYAAERAALVLTALAKGVPALDLMMAMADDGARDLPGHGKTLDALATFHFPAWRAGTSRDAGMGRRQRSAMVIPDPLSANTLAFPRYGILRPNGRISLDD